MKGRNSGQRKRLAAVVREHYVSHRRGLCFTFRVDPPEPFNAQKERDYRADDRRCRLARAGRNSLRGEPLARRTRLTPAEMEDWVLSLGRPR